MGLEVIQHLRGTAEENDLRIGFDGEFTVDKTNKAIRIHDGSTPGGSVVVSEESTRVSNVSELKSLNPTDNRSVVVEGYNSSDDNGGGVFVWRPGVTTSDGGVQIESNVSEFQFGESEEGVWARVFSEGFYDVSWWGAERGFGNNATSEIQAAFDSLPNNFQLRISDLYTVTGDLVYTTSFSSVAGSGVIFVDNNSDYNQTIDIQGNFVEWSGVNIIQSSANSHNGPGRGIKVTGEEVELEDVRFRGENSNIGRPNVYVTSSGHVEMNSCEFDGATSSVIEYNGSGTLTVNNGRQNSSDNTVSFLDLQSSITPGDVKVNGLDIETGNGLIAGTVDDSVKVQRNSRSPRIFKGEDNPDSLGLNVSYQRGDQILKQFVSAVDNVGWVCVSSGTPGRWKEFGSTKTKKSGNVLFDADGDQTSFRINHGLGGTPSTWNITPITSDSSVYSHVTANRNNLVIKYDYAPPSGTNNIGFNWEVDRNSVGLVDSNKTFLTEQSGKEFFDGDGSKTEFQIFHGLAGTPFIWDITSATQDSSNINYVRVSNRLVRVVYNTPPPSGSQNVELNWTVDTGFFDESAEDDGGQVRFNGDGSTTSFSVSHNLNANPIYWTAQGFSEDFNIDYYITSDSNQLTFNFESAPPTGTNNVRFAWMASVDEFSDINGESGGEESFSGDGSSTTFNIPHGLGSTPSVWNVTPTSSDASGLSYVTADSSNLILNFDSAPPSNMNNVSVTWLAKA